MMIVMIALLALALDIGQIQLARSELSRSVDAAALAGAGALVDGEEASRDATVEYLVRNPMGRFHLIATDDDLAARKAEFLTKYSQQLQMTTGHWDSDRQLFEVSDVNPSAVRVFMQYPDRPLFFARALGHNEFAVQAEAIAVFQPRDIVLVLDFSASMNDDSELTAIGSLGQDHVISNIEQMWNNLEAPTYGTMGFEPDWVTIPGATLPIAVRWRGTEVDVSSQNAMQKVRLYRSDGSYTTISTSATAGTFSYSANLIYKCGVRVGGVWETIDFFNNSHIRRGLGLDGVAYPSSGSWDDYIEYARSHSSSMPWYDSAVNAAGYRRKFGVLTLINFWNKNKPMSAETPNLWKVSAQPVTAVKDAVDLFVDYVGSVDADDRVGLVVYNGADGEATTELGLTDDFDLVASTMRHRQAGHYHHYTNIGAGMRNGREELEANGRAGALKMIVLMTDGQANWTNGRYDENLAMNRVLEEADLCRSERIPVVTISLGVDADQDLMQQVADTTKTTHFNIPGGAGVAEYSRELLDVFERIAKARPLRLAR